MKKFYSCLVALALFLFIMPVNAAERDERVILINTFTVPVGKVEEAIGMWEKARDFLKNQPGYLSTKLHRSLSADAKYQLINVAEWQNVETFKAATKLMREEANLPRIKGLSISPFLYKVIRGNN